mmetsp:Transcript_32051/g.65417  ORF Transcript_32051/g.65417 Transcript_32051/m.65417 type:complete len:220 (+) Transcript_32051:1135-1794(+)
MRSIVPAHPDQTGVVRVAQRRRIVGLDGQGERRLLHGPVARRKPSPRVPVLRLEGADLPKVLPRALELVQGEFGRAAAVVPLRVRRIGFDRARRVRDREAVVLDLDVRERAVREYDGVRGGVIQGVGVVTDGLEGVAGLEGGVPLVLQGEGEGLVVDGGSTGRGGGRRGGDGGALVVRDVRWVLGFAAAGALAVVVGISGGDGGGIVGPERHVSCWGGA